MPDDSTQKQTFTTSGIGNDETSLPKVIGNDEISLPKVIGNDETSLPKVVVWSFLVGFSSQRFTLGLGGGFNVMNEKEQNSLVRKVLVNLRSFAMHDFY